MMKQCVFLIITHTPVFNTPPPLKKAYKKTTYTFFYDTFKTNIFSKKPPATHFGMPKKMTPKSQAKINPPIPVIPIF